MFSMDIISLISVSYQRRSSPVIVTNFTNKENKKNILPDDLFLNKMQTRLSPEIEERRVGAMGFHSAVSCNETAVSCDGASMYFVVSDSPGPDHNDRDGFAAMGDHVVLSNVETSMVYDGFFNVFCCALVPMFPIIRFSAVRVSCFRHLIG